MNLTGRVREVLGFIAIVCMGAAGILAGCSGKSTRPDGTPPGATEDLRILELTETSVLLGWTAPGDDGVKGRATLYDFRYRPLSSQVAWEEWNRVQPMATPKPAGEPESLRVGGLAQGSDYTFRLRTADDAGNWSEYSNAVNTSPEDTTAPGPVTDLAVTVESDQAVTLHWTAPGDDGTQGTATSYEIRYSTTPLSSVHWLGASLAADPPSPLASGEAQELRITGLLSDTPYYFGLKATDDSKNQSALSNLALATTLHDQVAPDPVTDLSVVAITGNSVTVSWTASGDDGSVGRATRYDLRYSRNPLTEANWHTASAALTVPTPRSAGSPEQVRVPLLLPDTRYWLGIEVVDDGKNASTLSNVVLIETPKVTHWWVAGDGSGDAPTIQAGIDSAADGDTVLVGPGTYDEDIDFKGKDIVVASRDGRDATIIDGGDRQESVVLFTSGESHTAVLRGFTIQGGRGHVIAGHTAVGGGMYISESGPTISTNRILNNIASYGAGIYIDMKGLVATDASAIILHNIIDNNLCMYNGGGMAIISGSPNIEENLFISNYSTYDGGGVYIWATQSQATICNNEFQGNGAGDHGGGIYNANYPDLPNYVYTRIIGNVLAHNSAAGRDVGDTGSGGAIYVAGAGGEIRNNTIVDNRASGETPSNGGGIGLYAAPPSLTISFNIIAYNGDSGIACKGGGTPQAILGANLFFANAGKDFGSDNGQCPASWADNQIFADPIFCDPAHDDYHLASNSPALTGPAGPFGAYPAAGCGPK